MDIHTLAAIIIRGRKNIVFPLKLHGTGWIADSEGTHLLDVRGWGHFQYADQGAGEAIQDAFAAWVVSSLNAAYEAGKVSEPEVVESRRQIILNGKRVTVYTKLVTFDYLVHLAGLSGLPSITYRKGIEGSSGILTPDIALVVASGMVINVAHTGDA